MTQNDFDFERDLSDAFAPVRMPADLQRKLLQVPQVHKQRPASWINRLLPGRRAAMDMGGIGAVSARPVFGMTTSIAAACCSLVIGLSLGLGGALPQTPVSDNGSVAVSQNATASDADSASLLYAAADLQTGLSLRGDAQ